MLQLYANIAYELGRTFEYLQRSSIQNPITMEKQHVSSRQTVPNRANHSTFDWLVVWNMFNFPLIFHILGTIIPFDYYFSEGWNHQPVDISWNISHLPSTIWAPFTAAMPGNGMHGYFDQAGDGVPQESLALKVPQMLKTRVHFHWESSSWSIWLLGNPLRKTMSNLRCILRFKI